MTLVFFVTSNHCIYIPHKLMQTTQLSTMDGPLDDPEFWTLNNVGIEIMWFLPVWYHSLIKG